MPRFQRYFGIRVPVFEEEKMGIGTITIRFVLDGHVVSKKNNESAIPDTKSAKDYLYGLMRSKGNITLQDALAAVDMVGVRFIGNPGYRAFLKKFVPVIQEQMKFWEKMLASNGISYPIQKAAFNVKFGFKDKYITDTVNKMQTIHDLLTKAGAIRDDDYTVLNPIHGYSKRFYKKLVNNISFISLTVEKQNIEKKE